MEKGAIQIEEMYHPRKRTARAIARFRNRHGLSARVGHRNTEAISRSRMGTLNRPDQVAAEIEHANDSRIRHRGVVIRGTDENRVADHLRGKPEQSRILLLWRTKGGQQIRLQIEEVRFPCRDRAIVVVVVRDQDLVTPDGVQRDPKVVS